MAGYGERNPNSRSATRKAAVAADNVVLAARGETPNHTYEPHWRDEFIKLTLGMVSLSWLMWEWMRSDGVKDCCEWEGELTCGVEPVC